MTTIRVKENEPFDVALRRFKRTIEKLGLLTAPESPTGDARAGLFSFQRGKTT